MAPESLRWLQGGSKVGPNNPKDGSNTRQDAFAASERLDEAVLNSDFVRGILEN